MKIFTYFRSFFLLLTKNFFSSQKEPTKSDVLQHSRPTDTQPVLQTTKPSEPQPSIQSVRHMTNAESHPIHLPHISSLRFAPISAKKSSTHTLLFKKFIAEETIATHSAASTTENTANFFSLKTPLHHAVIAGDYQETRALLEKEGKTLIDEIDETGKTALHYAAEDKNLALCGLLTALNANTKIPDDKGVTAESLITEHINKTLKNAGTNEILEKVSEKLDRKIEEMEVDKALKKVSEITKSELLKLAPAFLAQKRAEEKAAQRVKDEAKQTKKKQPQPYENEITNQIDRKTARKLDSSTTAHKKSSSLFCGVTFSLFSIFSNSKPIASKAIASAANVTYTPQKISAN